MHRFTRAFICSMPTSEGEVRGGGGRGGGLGLQLILYAVLHSAGISKVGSVLFGDKETGGKCITRGLMY